MAARAYFGKDVQVIPCATFREVVALAGDEKKSAGAVMAIENSIAGSILPNYNLLLKSNLQIVGEVYLQINQHLMANPDVQLEGIREVHSHPMALQQCLDYLDKHHWKLVETEDTALSAKLVHRHKSKHIAAIASELAAELFELRILAPNIHSEKANYTRFLVLQRGKEEAENKQGDKASIKFHTDHSKGSLAKVLTAIAACDINLSKLQSMPIPGSEWQYSFYADMEFDTVEQFTEAIKRMEKLTQEIKVFGVYKKGSLQQQTKMK